MQKILCEINDDINNDKLQYNLKFKTLHDGMYSGLNSLYGCPTQLHNMCSFLIRINDWRLNCAL